MLLTVYCRKVENTPPRSFSVEVYRDKEMTRKFVDFAWWQTSRPDKRNKFITLNCYKWRIEWLPDLTFEEQC